MNKSTQAVSKKYKKQNKHGFSEDKGGKEYNGQKGNDPRYETNILYRTSYLKAPFVIMTF